MHKDMKIRILILVLTHFYAAAKEGITIPIQCDSDSYRCADNSRCVHDIDLCDYRQDCDDLSDEQFSMCKKFQEKRGSCSTPGQLENPTHGCASISHICAQINYYAHRQEGSWWQLLCQELENGLQPNEIYVAMKKEIVTLREEISVLQNDTTLMDIFVHLATSFNESNRSNNASDCPPLYTNMSGKCVALFTLAKVTWAEAKQFCKSISGSLAVLGDLNEYGILLKHLKNQDFTSDFWIGGHYTHSKSAGTTSWMWLDDKDIVMGAPYWSQYHTQNCTMRGTSPLCYEYSLAPRENRDGFCLSMDYAFHYYFTDQNCHENRSPLCFHNEN